MRSLVGPISILGRLSHSTALSRSAGVSEEFVAPKRPLTPRGQDGDPAEWFPGWARPRPVRRARLTHLAQVLRPCDACL